MPPSGLLVALYPADYSNSPGSTSGAVALKQTATAGIPNHERNNPSSRGADESSLTESAASTPPATSVFAAPFLEMEEDENHEEYDDAMLEDIPLDKDEGDDIIAAAPLSKRRAMPQHEEENETNHTALIPTPRIVLPDPVSLPALPLHDLMMGSSNAKNSSPTSCSSGSVRSCGKRRRSQRRVTFPATILQFDPSNASMNSCSGNDSDHQQSQNSSERMLVRVRDTIHRSDYTPEERVATWYNFADLKTFKRERKETARLMDDGLLSLPRFSTETAKRQSLWDDDSSSSSEIELSSSYCARGCENCTETIGRIRYRHIADGWRAVLNTQEKHHYEQQKMASMTSAEKNQFRTLASFLAGGSRKSSRTNLFFNANESDGSEGTDLSSKARMCCPYRLAAAYQTTSKASLEIARNRAIGDEREVVEQQAQEESEQEKHNNSVCSDDGG